MTRRDRKLYRDTDDQKIGGVCSGLAHYFDLDPVIVRVAFVASLVFGGFSLVAYLLLWWVVDEAPAGYYDAAPIDDAPPVPPSAPGSTTDAA